MPGGGGTCDRVSLKPGIPVNHLQHCSRQCLVVHQTVAVPKLHLEAEEALHSVVGVELNLERQELAAAQRQQHSTADSTGRICIKISI